MPATRCNRWTAATSVVAVLLAICIAYIGSNLGPVFDPEEIPNLSSGLNFVITGANSGVGYASVEHLVRAGTARTIVMACRNRKKCEDAKQRVMATMTTTTTRGVGTPSPPSAAEATRPKILSMHLDLSDHESIIRFAEDLPRMLSAAHDLDTVEPTGDATGSTDNNDNHESIDVLMNNAGVFSTSSAGVVYQEGIDEHVYVNHLGHVLLLHRLLPTLLKDNTRIVAVSSIASILPLDPTKLWYEDDVVDCSASLLSWQQWLAWGCWFPTPVRRIHQAFNSYARSKRANILFAHELHRRYSSNTSGSARDAGRVSSVAAHPGVASTPLWTNGAKVLPSFVSSFFQQQHILAPSSEEGAASQLWAAIDRHNVPSGWYVGPLWWLKGTPVRLGPIRVLPDSGRTKSSSSGIEDDKDIPSAHTETLPGPANSSSSFSKHKYPPIPHFWPFSQSDGERLWQESMLALGIEEFGKLS